MRAVAITVALVAAARAAHADTPTADEDRFFVDKVEDDDGEDRTLWQGSLTSTSFLHRENAGIAPPLSNGAVGTENAAPFMRLFTDLRAQLDARHLKGGAWDARVDARARYAPPGDGEYNLQSGTFGGDEYDVRELYLTRGGARTDVSLGRQIVLDLGGIKVDGIRLDHAASAKWTYLGFAGLYPVRGSRSLTTDYPAARLAGGARGGRVLPGTLGGGAAYRTQQAYGALGAVAIASLTKDTATQTNEPPRLYLTANGYWRPRITLDLFHYAVVDVVGANGAALTNLSLGANWKPAPRMRVSALLNQTDTETLNVQAQARLSEPQPLAGVNFNNEVFVARLSTLSARLGLSVSLGKTGRFEVSTSGAVRRRPDLDLKTSDGATTITVGAAQTAEVVLQAVDRRSILGLRLGGMVLRAFGVGGSNFARTSSLIVRLSAGRALASGNGEWSANLGYATSSDDNVGVACNATMLATCWGSAKSRTISLEGAGSYRIGRSWLGIASLELANQGLQVTDAMALVKQPSVIVVTALVRLSYRF